MPRFKLWIDVWQLLIFLYLQILPKNPLILRYFKINMAKLIEFQLFAPYNKEVAVIGCFSDWQAIAMEKELEICG
ncbi:MAG: hypothetical protein HC764_00965 [Pleurocapsa sp. CRU_1_2]|nr:hypothetical protein [Pleurocapsa sp. CRU_1_2]